MPLRRCVACRRSRPQAELARLALVPGDEGGAAAWRLDLERRAGGRGAWVCRDDESCRSPKRLGRAFRGDAQRIAALLHEALGSDADAGTDTAAPPPPSPAPDARANDANDRGVSPSTTRSTTRSTEA